jgi:hypothetical protein
MAETKAQHSTGQHRTAQHRTAQHSTAQHCTAQQSGAQYIAVQYSTVLSKSKLDPEHNYQSEKILSRSLRRSPSQKKILAV